MKKDYNLGDFGFFTTLIVSIIGIKIFSYPRMVIETTGNDAITITIIGGILSILFILFIESVISKNNYGDISLILESNFGKITKYLFLIIFCIYFITSAALGLRVFSELIRMHLLSKTPTEAILFTLIFTGNYHIRKGLENIISFNQIMFLVILIPIVLLLIFPLKQGDITNILPLFTLDIKNYLYPILFSLYSFSGYEIIYFIIPLMKNNNKVKKITIRSIIVVVFFYLSVIIVTLSVFTKYDAKYQMYSLITLARVIDIPGTFIERWDGIVLSLLIVLFYINFVSLYYFAGDTISKIFNFRDVKISLLFVSPIIYIFSLYPGNVIELEKITLKLSIPLFIITSVILPVLLYIKILIKKVREKG